MWRSGVLPGWGGVVLAAGLVLWLPLLPRPVRIVDGLMIGVGGIWMAWGIWRAAAQVRLRERHDLAHGGDVGEAVEARIDVVEWQGTALEPIDRQAALTVELDEDRHVALRHA